MVNDLYLSVVYRPVTGRRAGLHRQSCYSAQNLKAGRSTELADARDACEKLGADAAHLPGAVRARAA